MCPSHRLHTIYVFLHEGLSANNGSSQSTLVTIDRRKCQSLQKELEKAMGLLASQEADASAAEQDVATHLEARLEEGERDFQM